MCKILVVDDDQTARETVARILDGRDYSVVVAHGGEAGIKAAREERPHLVITDIVMPGGEGMAMIWRIRSEMPHVPIIAMSGGGTVGDSNYLDAARVLGADMILAKPFSAKEMMTAVEVVLDTRFGSAGCRHDAIAPGAHHVAVC